MRVRFVVSVFMLGTSLLVVACGSNERVTEPLHLEASTSPPATYSESDGYSVAYSDRDRIESPSVPQGDLEEFVIGNSRFALDLYRQLSDEPGNLFLSPYSISTALGMAYVGADGKTADEIAEAMNFTLPQQRLHPASNALERQLTTLGSDLPEDERFTLEFANSMWGLQGVGFEQSFLDTLAEHYGARLRLLNFAEEPDFATSVINDWIDTNTNGRIVDMLVPGDVNVDTVLVQTSTSYFKASWRHGFNELETTATGFQLLDGSWHLVQMMPTSASFPFVETDEYKAVRLPYVSTADGTGSEGSASMLVLLPQAGQFNEFESSFSLDTLQKIRDSLKRKEVDVYLPRFEFESRFDLSSQLQSLGIVEAFDPFRADFSGMQAMPLPSGISMDSVIHQAFVAVDEEGTEAAAATAGFFSLESAPEETFKADRPFIFLVEEDDTGTILFMGRMLNPCAGTGACESGDNPVLEAELPSG